MYLVIGAVFLLALAALQQVGGGATGFSHLVFPDGLLGEHVPQLFQLVAGHFLNKDDMMCDNERGKRRQERAKCCSLQRRGELVPQQTWWRCGVTRCFLRAHFCEGLGSSGPSSC